MISLSFWNYFFMALGLGMFFWGLWKIIHAAFALHVLREFFDDDVPRR